MGVFVLLLAALVAVTLALLLRPLLSRTPQAGGASGPAATGAAHPDGRPGAGAGPDAQGAAPRAAGEAIGGEPPASLEEGAPPAESAPPGFAPPAWRTALVIAVALPLLGTGIHFHLGSWESIAGGTDHPAGDPRALVERLAARLGEEPGDGEGWMRLARSYVALERYREGADAFAEAHRLLGDHPDLLAEYAEAVALAAGSRFEGRPAELIERALERDPRHAQALWLSGFAALQRARPGVAAERWRTLLALPETGPEQARVIESLIARVAGEPESAPDGREGPVLMVRVRLDERFHGELEGSESLFVYAQEEGGPPMPLAALRRPASALPLAVRLDDRASLLSERLLSSAQRVRVGARISRSGGARAQGGDIQGMSEAIDLRPGEIEVKVLLDRRLP